MLQAHFTNVVRNQDVDMKAWPAFRDKRQKMTDKKDGTYCQTGSGIIGTFIVERTLSSGIV